MKYRQINNETFARYYSGALRGLEEYLPLREIDTEELRRKIEAARNEIDAIERDLERAKLEQELR